MKKAVSLLLCVILIFSTFAFAIGAEAADIHTVQIKGKYHQAQARGMLAKVNQFRTGTNAWYWNSTNTKKIYVTGLKNYQYDYELEQIAMQRAAEIAVYYGAYMDEKDTTYHIRPNGKQWDTAHTKYNETNGYAIGENLYMGHREIESENTINNNADDAFNAWLEENKYSPYQSHRQNFLSVGYGFDSMAVACFEVDRTFYFVQLFRSKCISSKATTVSENTVSKSVELSSNFVKELHLDDSATSRTLNIGDSITLKPTASFLSTMPFLQEVNLSTGEVTWAMTDLEVPTTLTSSNPKIVAVSGNKITALKAGTVTVTASVYGASLKYTVTVNPTDLGSATVTLDHYADTYIYTGKPIEPKVTVTLGAITLSPADYSISYVDNTEIGTGNITLTGQGDYKGIITKAFTIIRKEDCKHHPVEDPYVPATCQHKAKTPGRHCDICDEVLTPQEEYGELAPHTPILVAQVDSTCAVKGFSEYTYCTVCYATIIPGHELPLKEHTVVTDNAVEPTCTTAGKTEGSHCSLCDTVLVPQKDIPALGHTYKDSKRLVKKATLTANGKVYQLCTRCGAQKVNSVLYRPKTYILAKAAYTYNGKVQKPKLAIKNAAGAYIGYAHYKAAIPNGKNVGRYKITVLFNSTAYAKQYKYLYYDILPKNTSAFVLAAGKKSVKVKWNTQKVQTNGYQIQYSLYADFRKATTYTLKNNKYNAATISKLTGGKKYYVRMRTYKTVKYAGKNINLFSVWSGKKSVTAKK